MSETMQWTGKAPETRQRLKLVFPPTHTAIKQVVVAGGKPAQDFPGLVIIVKTPFEPLENISIAITYEGERLHDPIPVWIPLPEPLLGNTVAEEPMPVPTDSAQLGRVIEARETLSKLCAVQKFFFALDRASNYSFLARDLADDTIKKPEHDASVTLVSDTTAYLLERLKLRWKCQPVPAPATAAQRAIIRDCSVLFRDSAKDVSGEDVGATAPNWTLVGESCCRFAAGDLRALACVDDKVPFAWPVTEPDSAFILMFAELAFAALDTPDPEGNIGIHTDMWSALLADLVRMQWYYWARFDKSPNIPRAFSSYQDAEFPLELAARVRIDNLFKSGLQRPALELLVSCQLLRYVNGF